MKNLLLIIYSLLFAANSFGQAADQQSRTQIMTLGVFHFDYPNLDAVKTDEKDKISVLDEPFRSEIIALAKALEGFKPTIIAVERTPNRQNRIDSLYHAYRAGMWELGKNEIYQLGFRIGHGLNIEKLYCIDDFGVHYDHILSVFNDSVRLARLSDYQQQLFEVEGKSRTAERVSSIIETIHNSNMPENIQNSMAGYLSGLFQYEEEAGDYTGVDFETGRWFNRNLRIFRNIQRIPKSSDDRILLIIGSDHLNLLNFFFERSNGFELVSPFPYIEKASDFSNSGASPTNKH